MQFHSLLPELMVSSLSKSLMFYRDILKWKVEYTRENPPFAFISKGKSQLMLQELVSGEKQKELLDYPFGRGINFQIEVISVSQIIEQLARHSYPIQRGVKDSWYRSEDIAYGCREMLVQDPDGYLLRFSEDFGEKSVKM